jgi:hemerythrin-like domain-containing protein
MVDLIALWHADHASFSRLLNVLEEQLAHFDDEQGPAFGLMLDIVSYLQEYADRFHHPREDAAFARLVLRDPSLRFRINRLHQEHRVVAVAGNEFVDRLNEVIAGGIVERAAIEASAALFLTYYRHHLATEESEILPRAASLLTAQDGRSVAAAVARGSDPLFGPEPQERYRELREYLDEPLARELAARKDRHDAH